MNNQRALGGLLLLMFIGGPVLWAGLLCPHCLSHAAPSVKDISPPENDGHACCASTAAAVSVSMRSGTGGMACTPGDCFRTQGSTAPARIDATRPREGYPLKEICTMRRPSVVATVRKAAFIRTPSRANPVSEALYLFNVTLLI